MLLTACFRFGTRCANLLLAIAHILTGPGVAGQQANLASLIPAAEVIVAAEIADTDYSRTPSDGPMTARAKVLAVVRGRLRRDQSFGFTETAWVGPSYRQGEVRILFLESAGPDSWRILSNLYAKANFFVERDAIPLLNINSLRRALERFGAPASGNVVLTQELLK
ncbi:MAG: hypothetical protein HW394_1149 [Acidobacteria bacterium]|nr:hypothetical protein [Acidobacteriota bacterium]